MVEKCHPFVVVVVGCPRYSWVPVSFAVRVHVHLMARKS